VGVGGVLPAVQPSAAASAADYMNISSMHPVALQPLPMPVPMYFGGGGGGSGGGSVHLSHQTVCPAHKTTSSSREHGWAFRLTTLVLPRQAQRRRPPDSTD
jgi:hypothetical protein